jgi:hypothetical protein
MNIDPAKACVIAAVFGLAACSPALNWREVRPEGTGLQAMFPCKPQRLARSVPLAGAPVQMRLASCVADGAIYALGYASVDDVTRIAPALAQLRDAAADNIGATVSTPAPFSVSGMTPNALAQRWSLQGRSADEKAVQEEMALFTKGTMVFQATLIGPKIDGAAASDFFDGLMFLP